MAIPSFQQQETHRLSVTIKLGSTSSRLVHVIDAPSRSRHAEIPTNLISTAPRCKPHIRPHRSRVFSWAPPSPSIDPLFLWYCGSARSRLVAMSICLARHLPLAGMLGGSAGGVVVLFTQRWSRMMVLSRHAEGVFTAMSYHCWRIPADPPVRGTVFTSCLWKKSLSPSGLLALSTGVVFGNTRQLPSPGRSW